MAKIKFRNAELQWFDGKGKAMKKKKIRFWNAGNEKPPVVCFDMPFDENKGLSVQLLVKVSDMQKELSL